MSDQYFDVRKGKIENWKARQIAYPGKFKKTHKATELKNLDDGITDVTCAGRLMSFRAMGKLAFAHLQDDSGKIQLAFKQDLLGEDYKFFIKNFDIGDLIGVQGEMFTTQKGEKTLRVHKAQLLSKGLHPLPEKWHGLQDPEIKARYRFLDLMMNDETKQRFEVRHKMIRFIRNFLEDNKFIEVETPVLTSASSGASARPFKTHHNALDIPLYLRIAPETYLKRLVAGGYERVFELARCFRNEGIDPSHLQEFTMLEFYAAYWDYRDNMKFVREMIQGMIGEATGSLQVEYQGTKLDFSGEWPEYKYNDLVLEHTKIDLNQMENLAQLQSAIKDKNMDIPLSKYVGLGALIDALYKRYCRPHLIQPCYLTMHPEVLVPLARRSDDHPGQLDIFQVLANTWEIVKAYSELVDPIEQRKRLVDQAKLAEKGDDEAMMLEEDFILAMEYGMPPMSGLGMGIERVVSLLTNSTNIRDVIFFPNMRPPKGIEELSVIEE